ncbi:MAG: RDD family protein [Xanthomonadales bacterium]|nr:RDD family protein [Xanthomonadales bacterium]
MLYDGVILLGLLMLASAIALPFGGEGKMAFQDFWITLWFIIVCAAYLTTSWRAGMTLGMRAWRVRLVNPDGGLIPWSKCLLRFLVGTISLAIFGLGVFWALYDSQRRGWHDLAANTLLIRLD